MNVTGIQFATQANSPKYTGKKYTDMDCQGFVETVLKDCGIRKPDGTPYNWKGSNSMWRNALLWKGTVAECLDRYGDIPLGAWVFIVKHDGGEVNRGYTDNEGNASHVGIYCLDRTETENCVRDSTRSNSRNGVGYRTLKSFTHIGLPYMIDYFGENSAGVTKDDALKALETLTKYIRGI